MTSNIEKTKKILISNGHYSPCDYVKIFNISNYSKIEEENLPSPADDHLEKSLDLNNYLIKHPAATFFVRVSGDSMMNAGINDNDILIVDRSLKPSHGKIVIAVVDGQMTVKRLYKQSGKLILMPENTTYKPIQITEDMAIEIWGVVVTAIHSVY